MKNRIENCNLKTTIQGALCGALTALIVVPFMIVSMCRIHIHIIIQLMLLTVM